ncbi:MAG: N-acetylmuramoyl-L-alanine amidase [Candidatus Binatia bacterium]|jgi:N-acetylmuramoyl-L-alanine amidase
MIRAVTVLFLLFATSTAHSAPLLDQLKPTSLRDGKYIRLEDWAKAIRSETKWLSKGRKVQASSKWSKLVFTIGSTRAEMNGVQLWLARPPKLLRGSAYISLLDLEKMIMPILHPPRNDPQEKITIICLDPGHGGIDPGNTEGRHQEKKLTLDLAKAVRKKLQQAGVKVVLTRDADKPVKLSSRAALALSQKADIFVSLHYNSAPGAGRSANGPEVYCLTPPGAASTNAGGRGTTKVQHPGNRNDRENALLAHHLQKALVKAGVPRDRGLKRARFAVLRYAVMPAVLIETGFMSNAGELKKITTTAHRDKTARAIADGILAYKATVERDS